MRLTLILKKQHICDGTDDGNVQPLWHGSQHLIDGVRGNPPHDGRFLPKAAPHHRACGKYIRAA